MARDRRSEVKQWLLGHPTATNKDVAASLGVSERTVGYARAELVAAGSIPPAWGDHKSGAAKKKLDPAATVTQALGAAAEGSPFDTQSTADLDQAVAKAAGTSVPKPDLDLIDEEEIDISKLKRILWRIARTDPDNRIRTQAAWTLTRIQNDIDDRPLGPGKPMKRADVVNRLVELYEGAGVGVVIESLMIFFDRIRKGLGQFLADSIQTFLEGGANAPEPVVENVAASGTSLTAGTAINGPPVQGNPG